MRTTKTVQRGRKTLLLALATLLLVAATACAGNPPATGGGLQVSTIDVPTSAGFGGGTIHYPTAGGPYGVVSLSPGFTESAAAIQHWGPYLASHGYVVITINTSNALIFPDQRSGEQLDALDYVIGQSAAAGNPLSGKVDPERRAVGGHSMGGGASLISAQNDAAIDAVIPLAPWNLSQPPVAKPTLMLACQSDVIAAVATNASPMYEAVTAEKLYVSVAGGDHFCVNSPAAASDDVGQTAVAFLRRFVDNNRTASVLAELCGATAPTEGAAYDDIRSTCPF